MPGSFWQRIYLGFRSLEVVKVSLSFPIILFSKLRLAFDYTTMTMPNLTKYSLFFLTVVASFTATSLNAQKEERPPQTREELEKAYQKRLTQEYINDVYIPKDLTDAFIQLNKLIDEPSRLKFKEVPEDVAAHKLHFSLGRWIAVNWGFYEGSRLAKFIRDIGIDDPDYMARFVIVSYHRNLNRKPLDVKSQVAAYQEIKEKEKEERLKNGEVIYETVRKKKKER